jgi:hypothetical protein
MIQRCGILFSYAHSSKIGKQKSSGYFLLTRHSLAIARLTR